MRPPPHVLQQALSRVDPRGAQFLKCIFAQTSFERARRAETRRLGCKARQADFHLADLINACSFLCAPAHGRAPWQASDWHFHHHQGRLSMSNAIAAHKHRAQLHILRDKVKRALRDAKRSIPGAAERVIAHQAARAAYRAAHPA